jgi:coniferyl-aldehyde dehydrogenase
MRIAQEEIFGPILPVLPYDTLDDAIAAIRRRPAPARAVRLRPRR